MSGLKLKKTEIIFTSTPSQEIPIHLFEEMSKRKKKSVNFHRKKIQRVPISSGKL